MIPKCITNGCNGQSAPALLRGVCLKCYSQAKKMVESGVTTWTDLEAKGLVLRLGKEALSPFVTEFNKITKGDSNAGS